MHVHMHSCVFMHACIASLHSAFAMLRIRDSWRASTMLTGESQAMLVCNTCALRTVRRVVLHEFALPWRITSGLTMPRHHPPHVNAGIGRCPVLIQCQNTHRGRVPQCDACVCHSSWKRPHGEKYIHLCGEVCNSPHPARTAPAQQHRAVTVPCYNFTFALHSPVHHSYYLCVKRHTHMNTNTHRTRRKYS
jgi:hypothetical protein